MISQPTFHRRRFTDHAPLPGPVNPLFLCGHDAASCGCIKEGTILHNNHDIEFSSWTDAEPTPQTATLQAFFIASLFAFGLGVHAKHESNPSHFQANHPTSSAAIRG